MVDTMRLGLNRIVSPSLGLAEFYELASSIGVKKVELRNDIGGRDPIDGMKPSEAARLAADRGIEVITVNALQKFNLASVRAKATAELKAMLELGKALACKAIVLCPNNDAKDARGKQQRFDETADALASFGPMFQEMGLLGYVEPLGFGISSLASLEIARDAIKKSGFSCYRIVHDTFHHHIGPDDNIVGKAFDVAYTGLVHISGVESDIAKADFRDSHRVLVGPADVMKSKEQVLAIDKLGFKGDFSFEPFSPAIQKLGKSDLAAALKKSIEYLLS